MNTVSIGPDREQFLLLDNPRGRTQNTERTSRGKRRQSPLLFRSAFYVLFLTTLAGDIQCE